MCMCDGVCDGGGVCVCVWGGGGEGDVQKLTFWYDPTLVFPSVSAVSCHPHGSLPPPPSPPLSPVTQPQQLEQI